MDYYVSLNGHLVPSLKPPEFPDVVKDEFVYRAHEMAALAAYIEERIMNMKRMGGLSAFIEEPVTDDSGSTKKRKKAIFVPLHMFTYVDTTMKMLQNEIPSMQDEGLILQ